MSRPIVVHPTSSRLVRHNAAVTGSRDGGRYAGAPLLALKMPSLPSYLIFGSNYTVHRVVRRRQNTMLFLSFLLQTLEAMRLAQLGLDSAATGLMLNSCRATSMCNSTNCLGITDLSFGGG